jgi:hypothetical protein
MPDRQSAAVMAIAAAIAAVCLWPHVDPTAAPGFSWCVACGLHTLDTGFNIAGYLPLGLALAAAGARPATAVAAAAALSATVESLQASGLPGRHGELADILTNALGALIGVGAWRLRAWLTPSGRTDHVLSLVALAGFAAVSTATAVLLTPWWPGWSSTDIYGQRAPDRPPYPRFGGDLRGFEAAGVLIPNDRIADPSPLRRAEAAGELDTSITLRPPDRVEPGERRIAVLVSRGYDAVVFVARDDDVVFRGLLRAGQVGLRSPGVVIGGALAGTDPLVVRGAIRRTSISARVAPADAGDPQAPAPADSRGERVDFTVGLGWALLVGMRTSAAWLQHAATYIWLAVVALPMGYFGRTWSGAIRAAAIGATLIVGFEVAPLVAGIAPTPLDEWMAAFGGLAAGAGMRRRFEGSAHRATR